MSTIYQPKARALRTPRVPGALLRGCFRCQTCIPREPLLPATPKEKRKDWEAESLAWKAQGPPAGVPEGPGGALKAWPPQHTGAGAGGAGQKSGLQAGDRGSQSSTSKPLPLPLLPLLPPPPPSPRPSPPNRAQTTASPRLACH